VAWFIRVYGSALVIGSSRGDPEPDRPTVEPIHTGLIRTGLIRTGLIRTGLIRTGLIRTAARPARTARA
jgi:hypothetical protein